MEVKTELIDQEVLVPDGNSNTEQNVQPELSVEFKTELDSPAHESSDDLNKSDSKTPPTTPQCQSPTATPDRQEKSLGILTMKFVQLLQESPKGELDLKAVC